MSRRLVIAGNDGRVHLLAGLSRFELADDGSIAGEAASGVTWSSPAQAHRELQAAIAQAQRAEMLLRLELKRGRQKAKGAMP